MFFGAILYSKSEELGISWFKTVAKIIGIWFLLLGFWALLAFAILSNFLAEIKILFEVPKLDANATVFGMAIWIVLALSLLTTLIVLKRIKI